MGSYRFGKRCCGLLIVLILLAAAVAAQAQTGCPSQTIARIRTQEIIGDSTRDYLNWDLDGDCTVDYKDFVTGDRWGIEDISGGEQFYWDDSDAEFTFTGTVRLDSGVRAQLFGGDKVPASDPNAVIGIAEDGETSLGSTTVYGMDLQFDENRTSGTQFADVFRVQMFGDIGASNVGTTVGFELSANHRTDYYWNQLYSQYMVHQWTSGSYVDSRINTAVGTYYSPRSNVNNTLIGTALGLWFQPIVSNAGGRINTASAVKVEQPTTTGPIGNFHGIWIRDLSGSNNSNGILIEAQDNNGSASKTSIYMQGGNWNNGNVRMENGYLWYDRTYDAFRVSKDADGSAPTAEDDGVTLPLSHAEIYANDVDLEHTISGSGQANRVQVTAFNANGESFIDTPDHTNDHITIQDAGTFMVMLSMTMESVAGSAAEFGYAVYINNGATELTNMHGHRDLAGGGGQAGSLSLSGLYAFSASDTVEVWVWNETNTQNVKIDDVNLSVVRIK